MQAAPSSVQRNRSEFSSRMAVCRTVRVRRPPPARQRHARPRRGSPRERQQAQVCQACGWAAERARGCARARARACTRAHRQVHGQQARGEASQAPQHGG